MKKSAPSTLAAVVRGAHTSELIVAQGLDLRRILVHHSLNVSTYCCCMWLVLTSHHRKWHHMHSLELPPIVFVRVISHVLVGIVLVFVDG